ncbi:MAG: hypothetical protein QM817_27505 [Archangium sp.]
MRFTLLAVLLAAACAPERHADPYLGTFNYVMTGTQTETAPIAASDFVYRDGTFAITTGRAVDYVVTIVDAKAPGVCVLSANLNEKRDGIVTPGQQCSLSLNSRGTVPLTFTSGGFTAGTLADPASGVVTLTVEYTYEGRSTSLGGYGMMDTVIEFAGSGTGTFTGTPF